MLSYLKTNLKDLANHYHAAVSERGARGEKPANYARGAALVPRLPRVVPEGRRVAADQLPARGPAAREQGFRRGGAGSTSARPTTTRRMRKSAAAGYAAIYAHREQLKAARPRSSRTPSSATPSRARCKFADTFPQHEHAAAVLGAAADDLYEMKDYRAADRGGAEAHRTLSGRATPAIRRSAWIVVAHALVRARRVPAGRAGLRPGARAHAGGRRVARRRWSTTSPPRSTSRASRRTRRRTIAPPPTTSCAIKQAAPTSQIRAGGRVRRGRRADPAAGLDGGGGRARGVPQQLPGARAAARGHQADRVRLPPERPAVARRRRIRPHRLGVERSRICAARRCSSRATSTSSRRPRSAALAAYTRYVERVPAAGRDRRRDALQDRRDAQGGARRAALPPGAAADRPHRRGSRRRTHRPHADARGPLGAGARGAALRRVRRGASCGSRSRRACRRSSGSWTPRSRPSSGWSTTRSATSRRPRRTTWPRPTSTSAASLMESERPADLQAAELQEYELALEEEAFPFEEKAIDVHEKNMELMRAGDLQRVDREEPRQARRADAGALREGRAEQRLPRLDRALRVRRAHRAAAARARSTQATAAATPPPSRRATRPRRPTRRRRRCRSRRTRVDEHAANAEVALATAR